MDKEKLPKKTGILLGVDEVLKLKDPQEVISTLGKNNH